VACYSLPKARSNAKTTIDAPKAKNGYRGIHVVGRYAARAETSEPWNGQRIEIQLRTQLQHAFATAVETVNHIHKVQPLKFGAGPAEWRRFFSLGRFSICDKRGPRLMFLDTPTEIMESYVRN
jgi:hypothetical protein